MSHPRAVTVSILALTLAFPTTLISQTRSEVKVIPALNPADLDRSVAACTDFYQFANGGWLSANPVPAAFSTWGSFNELTERNNALLRTVLESAARSRATTPDPNTKKVGTFYASCMDSAAADSAGIQPIRAELTRIDAIPTRPDVNAAIAHLHAIGIPVVFRFFSAQDDKNSVAVIANAVQGGLGLPNRDYYTRTDPNSVRLREAYIAHAAKLLQLAGSTATEARTAADRVMALETALAKASMTPVELRDPVATYHMMTVKAVDSLTPTFDWSEFLGAVGLRGVKQINVNQPEFFRTAGTLLDQLSVSDWKAYLRVRVLDAMASSLSKPFVLEDFTFRSKLTGAREMQPRWRRCLVATDRVLGEALGKEYVKIAFTPQAKAKVQEMVENLRTVMRDRIMRADWMSEPTKKQALIKLAAFNRKVGYPDVWRDYRALAVEPGPYAANILRANEFSIRRNLEKIGKPVDRGEWGMTPPTVNAYYSPSLNEIVFPAGRLQTPFFHPSYDEAANYGGIGGTIGHEMSHGFDDQGRQYDEKGNLRDWWTDTDASLYTQRARVVLSQYNAYTVLDTVHVNGALTLGENLADVVGVSVAYEAMKRAIAGKPQQKIDGFTPEQRFFLAYAQARRANQRPEQALLQIRTDPHSPGKYRVNGPLSNMPEFAEAFSCKADDPMVRQEYMRAKIW
ncbi:MAG TPA: M13 family metallopeptidase [Gemmatimonadaceae bacterium]